MRQAYDYWQDQPGTYHRRRARSRRAPPAGPRPPGCRPQRALARPPGPASRRAPSRFVGGHVASARSRRLRTPGRVFPRLGGACLRPGRGPSCPCGVAPAGVRSPAPGLRRPQPRPGPGGFRRPGASPHASEERASGRAGGRAAHAGWPPRALARQPPACAVLAWPDRVPASFWITRSERRRLHASSHGAPLGTVRLRTATLTKACDPSATASALPLGRPPLQKTPPGYAAATARLTPRARLDATTHRRQDTDAHGRPPARAWLRRRAELAPWPPPEALPPCALRADPTRLPHTICSGTMRACENGGPPPLPFSGGEERPPPLPKWEGRREASSSSPPVFGRGGALGAEASGPRPVRPRPAGRAQSRLGAAHLRTGGEEECTRTTDTNPGCNYLVRCI